MVLLVGQLLQPTYRGAADNFRQVRPPYYRQFGGVPQLSISQIQSKTEVLPVLPKMAPLTRSNFVSSNGADFFSPKAENFLKDIFINFKHLQSFLIFCTLGCFYKLKINLQISKIWPQICF